MRTDGSITIKFHDYSQTSPHSKPTYDQEDIEGDNEETALVIIANELPEEVWDNLEESSGKFDYFVKYSAPASAGIPIEKIVITGWGDDDDNDNDPFTIIKVI